MKNMLWILFLQLMIYLPMNGNTAIALAEGAYQSDSSQSETAYIVGELIQPISSETSQVGDPAFFTTTTEQVMDRMVDVPAGTLITGQIVRVQKAGPWGSEGKVRIRIHTMTTPDGKVSTITGKILKMGRQPDFFTRYSLLGVFVHGSAAKIAKGEKYVFCTSGEVTEYDKFVQAVKSQPE